MSKNNYEDIIAKIDEALDIADRLSLSRPASMVRTKLDEAQLWAGLLPERRESEASVSRDTDAPTTDAPDAPTTEHQALADAAVRLREGAEHVRDRLVAIVDLLQADDEAEDEQSDGHEPAEDEHQALADAAVRLLEAITGNEPYGYLPALLRTEAERFEQAKKNGTWDPRAL